MNQLSKNPQNGIATNHHGLKRQLDRVLSTLGKDKDIAGQKRQVGDNIERSGEFHTQRRASVPEIVYLVLPVSRNMDEIGFDDKANYHSRKPRGVVRKLFS